MWKLDSLGLTGSRNDFYLVILEECDLVGLNWKEIEPFFGKANKEGSLFSCYSYRYYSKIDSIYTIPVREFIEIDVDNDKRKIIRFRRGYNDFFILR
ncbi:MAG: hypothetical protein ACEQSR_02135 [Candidatus Methylacidiphilales bacterium]